MEFEKIGIEGAWLAKSPILKDERGDFREWFKSEEILSKTGFNFEVAQSNVSTSAKGVVRGIHYSIAPEGQAKWITCVSGSIQDVIVDIRPDSTTFGQWVDVELKSESGKAIFISEGLGHGFLALEDSTAVAYLVSTPFSPTHEFEINPLDQKIGIDWRMQLSDFKISNKDVKAPSLMERFKEGKLPSAY